MLGKNTASTNKVVSHFIGSDTQKSIDLRNYDQDYDINTLIYLTQLQDARECIKYVFKTGLRKPFINQLRFLNLLANRFQRPALFITPLPAEMDSSHFICGVLYQNQMLLINPLGRAINRDLLEILKAIIDRNHENIIKRLYITTDIIQKDVDGQSSCGPICVELLKLLYQSMDDLKSRFECWSALPGENGLIKEGLHYFEVCLGDVYVPDRLKGMTEGNVKSIMTQIRAIHCEELQTLPLVRLIQDRADKKMPSVEEQNAYLDECVMNAPEQELLWKLAMEDLRLDQMEEEASYQTLYNRCRKSRTYMREDNQTSAVLDSRKSSYSLNSSDISRDSFPPSIQAERYSYEYRHKDKLRIIGLRIIVKDCESINENSTIYKLITAIIERNTSFVKENPEVNKLFHEIRDSAVNIDDYQGKHIDVGFYYENTSVEIIFKNMGSNNDVFNHRRNNILIRNILMNPKQLDEIFNDPLKLSDEYLSYFMDGIINVLKLDENIRLFNLVNPNLLRSYDSKKSNVNHNLDPRCEANTRKIILLADIFLEENSYDLGDAILVYNQFRHRHQKIVWFYGFIDALEKSKNYSVANKISIINEIILQPQSDGWRLIKDLYHFVWYGCLKNIVSKKLNKTQEVEKNITIEMYDLDNPWKIYDEQGSNDDSIVRYEIDQNVESQLFDHSATRDGEMVLKEKIEYFSGRHDIKLIKINSRYTFVFKFPIRNNLSNKSPEDPISEYNVSRLSRLICGVGVQEGMFVKIRYNDKIVYVNIHEFFEGTTMNAAYKDSSKQNYFNNISIDSFTRHFLRVLLTNPEDDKDDDYFFMNKSEDSPNNIDLIRIDCERAFYPEHGEDGYILSGKLCVKSMIYCLEHMKMNLSEKILRQFCKFDFNALIDHFIRDVKVNLEYVKKLLEIKDLPTGGLKIANKVINDIYKRFTQATLIVQNQQFKISGLILLRDVNPELFKYYKDALELECDNRQNWGDIAEMRFKAVAGAQYGSKTVKRDGAVFQSRVTGASPDRQFVRAKLSPDENKSIFEMTPPLQIMVRSKQDYEKYCDLLTIAYLSWYEKYFNWLLYDIKDEFYKLKQNNNKSDEKVTSIIESIYNFLILPTCDKIDVVNFLVEHNLRNKIDLSSYKNIVYLRSFIEYAIILYKGLESHLTDNLFEITVQNSGNSLIDIDLSNCYLLSEYVLTTILEKCKLIQFINLTINDQKVEKSQKQWKLIEIQPRQASSLVKLNISGRLVNKVDVEHHNLQIFVANCSKEFSIRIKCIKLHEIVLGNNQKVPYIYFLTKYPFLFSLDISTLLNNLICRIDVIISRVYLRYCNMDKLYINNQIYDYLNKLIENDSTNYVRITIRGLRPLCMRRELLNNINFVNSVSKALVKIGFSNTALLEGSYFNYSIGLDKSIDYCLEQKQIIPHELMRLKIESCIAKESLENGGINNCNNQLTKLLLLHANMCTSPETKLNFHVVNSFIRMLEYTIKYSYYGIRLDDDQYGNFQKIDDLNPMLFKLINDFLHKKPLRHFNEYFTRFIDEKSDQISIFLSIIYFKLIYLNVGRSNYIQLLDYIFKVVDLICTHNFDQVYYKELKNLIKKYNFDSDVYEYIVSKISFSSTSNKNLMRYFDIMSNTCVSNLILHLKNERNTDNFIKYIIDHLNDIFIRLNSDVDKPGNLMEMIKIVEFLSCYNYEAIRRCIELLSKTGSTIESIQVIIDIKRNPYHVYLDREEFNRYLNDFVFPLLRHTNVTLSYMGMWVYSLLFPYIKKEDILGEFWEKLKLDLSNSIINAFILVAKNSLIIRDDIITILLSKLNASVITDDIINHYLLKTLGNIANENVMQNNFLIASKLDEKYAESRNVQLNVNDKRKIKKRENFIFSYDNTILLPILKVIIQEKIVSSVLMIEYLDLCEIRQKLEIDDKHSNAKIDFVIDKIHKMKLNHKFQVIVSIDEIKYVQVIFIREVEGIRSIIIDYKGKIGDDSKLVLLEFAKKFSESTDISCITFPCKSNYDSAICVYKTTEILSQIKSDVNVSHFISSEFYYNNMHIESVIKILRYEFAEVCKESYLLSKYYKLIEIDPSYKVFYDKAKSSSSIDSDNCIKFNFLEWKNKKINTTEALMRIRERESVLSDRISSDETIIQFGCGNSNFK